MRNIPLILVPGLLCDDALWEFQVAALDKIATGMITDRHMYNDSIGKIAEAIVDQAPSRFALAGLSMGGYIALEICRKYGDRVDRLALVDTSARAETTEQTERRKNLMALCRQGKFTDVVELLCSVLVHPGRLNDTVLKRQIADMAHRMGPEVFFRQQRAIIDRPDQVANLSKITCPTIVVCGKQDQITPVECSEEMAAHIKTSELAIIPDCGHMSTMEKPEEVSSALHYWLTLPSGQ